MTRRSKPLVDRFWAQVTKGAPADCWPWRGYPDHNGYGKINGGTERPGWHIATRLAYEYGTGAPAGALHVLHRCDNRACCNPAHLFLGTNADNVRDKVAKGRQRPGEKAPSALFANAVAERIRARTAAGETCAALAREYGVATSTISRIKRSKTYLAHGAISRATE